MSIFGITLMGFSIYFEMMSKEARKRLNLHNEPSIFLETSKLYYGFTLWIKYLEISIYTPIKRKQK